MKSPLTVETDLSEKINYNLHNFPIYSHIDELSRYDYIALCHWHPDLEFIKIDSGIMDYYVNGKIIRLTAGKGIFVNSKRLHYGFSKERYDCTFRAVVIHPDLFINSCETVSRYTEEKFGFYNEDYIELSPQIPWQNQILENMIQIQNDIHTEETDPLSLLAIAVQTCALIANHIQPIQNVNIDNRHHDAFLAMSAYIESHFGEKIDIDMIAQAASVSRSLCCRLFQNFSAQSPTQYLTRYRLEKSQQLLRDTNLTITEISTQCGFQTPSYFTSVFKKSFNTTPKAYRSGFNK